MRPAWFGVVVNVLLELFTRLQFVGVELRVVALVVGAFDVGLEHRDDLVGVRGGVGGEDAWYVARVGALGCVLERLSGAWLVRGCQSIVGSKNTSRPFC